MNFNTYQMGFRQPVAVSRLEAFITGKLDVNAIVVLMQDIIETGQIPALPQPIFVAAQHCVNMGLAHVTGRAFH